MSESGSATARWRLGDPVAGAGWPWVGDTTGYRRSAMTDEKSPWARPGSDFEVTAPGPPSIAGAPDPVPAVGGVVSGPADSNQRAGGPGIGPGVGTRSNPPTGGPAGSPGGTGELDPAGSGRSRAITMFGLAAGGLVALGLVVVLVLAFNGTFSDGRSGFAGLGGDEPTTDNDAPPLAKLCPPPTGTKSPEYAEPEPPPPGKRTVDQDTGISYAAYGDPWRPWNDDWSGGDLRVHYRIGQHFVTETYSGGTYHASILSGSVPATVNDGMTLDLKCTGRQVAADVRTSYYPQPNRPKEIRDKAITLGGRPAWVSIFRLHFKEPGLKATDELVAVVLIDVGRPEAAVLYVSIPGTHDQYDHVVSDVIDSVRPIE